METKDRLLLSLANLSLRYTRVRALEGWPKVDTLGVGGHIIEREMSLL
jgi:hypothetical protein